MILSVAIVNIIYNHLIKDKIFTLTTLISIFIFYLLSLMICST